MSLDDLPSSYEERIAHEADSREAVIPLLLSDVFNDSFLYTKEKRNEAKKEEKK